MSVMRGMKYSTQISVGDWCIVDLLTTDISDGTGVRLSIVIMEITLGR